MRVRKRTHARDEIVEDRSRVAEGSPGRNPRSDLDHARVVRLDLQPDVKVADARLAAPLRDVSGMPTSGPPHVTPRSRQPARSAGGGDPCAKTHPPRSAARRIARRRGDPRIEAGRVLIDADITKEPGSASRSAARSRCHPGACRSRRWRLALARHDLAVRVEHLERRGESGAIAGPPRRFSRWPSQPKTIQASAGSWGDPWMTASPGL